MTLKRTLKLSFTLLFIFSLLTPLMADEKPWDHFLDNLRWSIDLSMKGTYNTQTNHLSHTEVIGLDLHTVLTYPDGRDIGTLLFQGYFTKLNNAERYPAFFKNASDLKFICRMCYFNASIMDKGQLNLRIGHFELPFGLEYNFDSNGTLRQYSNGRNLGTKIDWGLAFNGQFSWGGYELAFTRGHGVDWKSDSKSYIVSGRIEMIKNYHSFIGLSSFYGRLKSTSGYYHRSRIGLDIGTQFTFINALAEISIGKDANIEKINSLLEINVHNNTEKLLGYLQLKHNSQQRHSWDSMYQMSLGARYTPNNAWVLSSQWTHDLKTFDHAKRASVLELQLRYRF
jgi:hypothetical protein